MDMIDKLYDSTSLALRSQNALGFALPPFVPFKTKVKVRGYAGDGTPLSDELQEAVDSGRLAIGETCWQVPVRLRLDSEPEKDGGLLLPLDPLVSVSGRNVITRRYVSKSQKRGSIKERWSQDDWEITIAGLITDDDNATTAAYMAELRRYCEARESIHITCDLLNNYFDVTRIAIETYDFPFTKGIENQQFTIKAYSDDLYDLLIE